MTYNIDEGKSDNHYNCPVVAYYPEVIRANMHLPEDVTVIGDYVGLHRRELPKSCTRCCCATMTGYRSPR